MSLGVGGAAFLLAMLVLVIVLVRKGPGRHSTAEAGLPPRPADSNSAQGALQTARSGFTTIGFASQPPPGSVSSAVQRFLSEMQEFEVKVSEGRFAKNGNLGYAAGKPPSERIRVNGKEWTHGISIYPVANDHGRAKFRLAQTATKFLASAALNDSAGALDSAPGVGNIPTPVTFRVIGDDVVLWRSEPVDAAGVVRECAVDVTGVDILELRVNCPGANVNTQTVWLDPYVVATSYMAGRPVMPLTPPAPVPAPATVPQLRTAAQADGGPRLELYGGLTKAQWEKLNAEEQRAVLLEWVDKKAAEEQREFEVAGRSVKQRLDVMQVPSQAAAFASQVRSVLLPAVDTLSANVNVVGNNGRVDYIKCHFYMSAPDIQTINAASDAIGATIRVQEELAKLQRDLASLAEEAQAVSMKYAKSRAGWELKRREILRKYPHSDDPEFTPYKGMLLTPHELEAMHSFEKEHGSPRAAAGSYILSLPGLTPVYYATYAHATRSDLAAVCYSSVTPGMSQPMSLYLCKTGEGYWFVNPRPNRSNNLFRGNPLKIFKRTDEQAKPK